MPAEANPLPFLELTERQKQRYWAKVLKGPKNECWPWIGALKGKGYGIIRVNTVAIGASRLGWFIVHGKDPVPLHVLHHCDNPACSNPSHWFLGTNLQNVREKSRRLRNARKLTPAQVLRIKRLLSRSNESQQRIAERYGVNQTLISAIKRRVVWASL